MDTNAMFGLIAAFWQTMKRLVDIDTAPIAPERCSVSLETSKQVTAGQQIRLKVELFDIDNNPFTLENTEENQLRFSYGDRRRDQLGDDLRDEVLVERFSLKGYEECYKDENSSKKVSLIGTNIYFLYWTPQIPGSRSISVSVDDRELGTEKVHVDPGPLKCLIIDKHDEPVKEECYQCYTNETQNIYLKGFDEFGNTVQLDSEWHLEVGDGNKSHNGSGAGKDVGNDIQCKVVDKGIECTYSFPKEGTYSVHVAGKTQSKVSVPKPFSVKVSAAPLEHSKCKVRAETPLFARRPTKVILKLELFDCILMPYEYSKVDKKALKMKINGNLCSIVESHHSINNKPNETSLEASVNEEGSVDCSLEYKGGKLGEPFHIDVIQVVPYRENDYVSDVNDPNAKLLYIYNIPTAKVIGADHSNLDNINNILRKNYNKGILSSDFTMVENRRAVSVDLSMFESIQKRGFVRQVFCKLIEGIHYRNQASEFNENREEWKLKSETEYQSRRYEYANEYSEIKERFGELMNSSNRSASDAIFGFFNRGREGNEIDLHGQLVADETKLVEHRNQLHKKGKKNAEVEKKISSEREEMDEAIRHLKQKIKQVKADQTFSWLEIIVGAGHHSLGQRQKIRPKVETFLKEQGKVYRECNKGSLLITFREYHGKQPCHATFYCSKCDKTWKSNSSWRGKWQKCFKCDKKGKDSKCTPMKLRNRETPQSRGSTNTGTSFTREDHKKLCQMCIEKGQDCSTP